MKIRRFSGLELVVVFLIMGIIAAAVISYIDETNVTEKTTAQERGSRDGHIPGFYEEEQRDYMIRPCPGAPNFFYVEGRRFSRDMGYAFSLAMGLEELKKKYQIKRVLPVREYRAQYRAQGYTYVRALLVMTEPKSQTARKEQ